jgi:hypothetical protein
MARTVLIVSRDKAESVTAEPEEVEVLAAAGFVETSRDYLTDYMVVGYFTFEDVLNTLREMRNPDVV